MAITIWTGLVLGSIYALVATGFAIAMVLAGVFNSAQGAIVVAGTFVTYQLLVVSGVPSGWRLVVTAVVGAALGLLCELVTVRPLRWSGGSVDNAIVTTVGASTVIVGLIGVKWGYLPLEVPFRGPNGFVYFLGTVAIPVQIFTVAGAVLPPSYWRACSATPAGVSPAWLSPRTPIPRCCAG
jgi:branched-chain amino acid transport system permease protein